MLTYAYTRAALARRRLAGLVGALAAPGAAGVAVVGREEVPPGARRLPGGLPPDGGRGAAGLPAHNVIECSKLIIYYNIT